MTLCRFASSSGRFERSCCFFPLFHMHLLCLLYRLSATIYKVIQSNKAELLDRSTPKRRQLLAIQHNVRSQNSQIFSYTDVRTSSLSCRGFLLKVTFFLRCDAVLIGNLLHFGGTGLFQFHGSATPAFVLVLYDYRQIQCFPNFFARVPLLYSKNSHGSSHTC